MGLALGLGLTNQRREGAGLHKKRKLTYRGGGREAPKQLIWPCLTRRTLVSGHRVVNSEEENMRLRSQKTLTPRPETPRNSRRPSNKATPRPTRFTSAAGSPTQAQVNVTKTGKLTGFWITNTSKVKCGCHCFQAAAFLAFLGSAGHRFFMGSVQEGYSRGRCYPGNRKQKWQPTSNVLEISQTPGPFSWHRQSKTCSSWGIRQG